MSAKLLEDMFVAYYDARRNKRNTINQLKFELKLEDNLLRLYNEIKNRTYTPGKSVAFIIDNPVKREVFAATFADRVVHHLYFNYVNEIFERTFITDSYSCRKGRGTSYGIKRIDHHIRSCSENYTKECYVLKLDLSGYFMSINRDILYSKIEHTLLKYADRKSCDGRKFRDVLDYDLLMYLTRTIVFHNSVQNCSVKGELNDWKGLPPDKSLFYSAPCCGLPIGNLTSQLFSNVYLNDFDHYIKRELQVKHYGRYVDDFFIVHRSKAYLVTLTEKIRLYLKASLGAILHPRKIYLQNIFRGVAFLGVVVKPHRIYTLERTVTNFKQALARLDKTRPVRTTELTATLNSYLGIMKHYRTFNLRKQITELNRCIFQYGWVNVGRNKFTLDTSLASLDELQALPFAGMTSNYKLHT